MGREIRRVPQGWEHPRYNSPKYFGETAFQGDRYHPLFDRDYDIACIEWIEGLAQWQAGTHEDQTKYNVSGQYYWEWNGNPPDEMYHRSKGYETLFNGPADFYQVYETVSEGTPTSPIFETLPEMVEWLISEGYSKEAAEAFTEGGYAPSMVFSAETGVVMDIESLAILDKE